MTDWEILKREIPRADRGRSTPKKSVAQATAKVHKRGHGTPAVPTPIMLRFSGVPRKTQMLNVETQAMTQIRPSVSPEDNSTDGNDTDEMNTNLSDTVETMTPGPPQRQDNANEVTSEPTTYQPHTSISPSWRTTVNRERSKTAEIVKVVATGVSFDTYARGALEGNYGPQAEAIAWRAFPYSNMNRSTFDSSAANEAANDAVRFLTWRSQMLDTELSKAQQQSDELMRYVVADVGSRIGTQPVTNEVVAKVLLDQGMAWAWMETNVENITRGVKQMRGEPTKEAVDMVD